MDINYQTQTYNYLCPQRFISICAYRTAAAGRMLATSLSRVSLTSRCNIVYWN